MQLVQHAQEFTVPKLGGYTGQWTVPANVTFIRAMIIGAGGGGGGSREASAFLSAGGSGGGCGEIAINVPIVVEPGTVLTITLGTKGSKGIILPLSTAGGSGTSTIVQLPNGLTYQAAGGAGGTGGSGGGDGRGGDGGGPWGGSLGPYLLEPIGQDGAAGSPAGIWPWVGGPSGGSYIHAGSHAGISTPSYGGPAPGIGATPAGITDGSTNSGGPGAASIFGYGGPPGNGKTPNTGGWNGSPPPTGSWGAGGGGGGTDGTPSGNYITLHRGDGAAGENGYVLLTWMESVE